MAKKIVEKTIQEQVWEPARLIPVSGIKNSEEQERRASSALLAVLKSVDEFGNSIVRQCGGIKGKIDTFIEVPFKLASEKVVRPDGVIRTKRGSREHVILVEVKTGNNCLQAEQIEQYLDVAQEQGFDCVLTISNEIPKIPGEHPVLVDKKKCKKIGLVHLSWSCLLTEAFVQRDDHGVEDPDQAWILGELIRYLEHPNAGSIDFSDMGEHWVGVRDGVKNGTLRRSDSHAVEIAGKWEELITFAALELGRQLGSGVQEVLSTAEKKDLGIRITNIVNDIVGNGLMKGVIRIPNTIGDVEVVADLRSQQVVTSVKVPAPDSGKAKTRIGWLIRQLKNTTIDVRIDSWGNRSRTSMSELLSRARDKPELLTPEDNRELKSFTVTLIEPMGLSRSAGKRSTAKSSFVNSVLAAIKEFYSQVVQHLSEWQPPTPKLNSQRDSASRGPTPTTINPPINSVDPVVTANVKGDLPPVTIRQEDELTKRLENFSIDGKQPESNDSEVDKDEEPKVSPEDLTGSKY